MEKIKENGKARKVETPFTVSEFKLYINVQKSNIAHN